MELKELTDKTLELFNVADPQKLGEALIVSCSDVEKLRSFRDLINDELEKDWMQMIYQYYLADRKEKKQDYTPATLADFMGRLTGDSDKIIDMCAGTGALIIQKWADKPSTQFVAMELDENVIPFLLFNMVLRNIKCKVIQIDVLSGEGPAHQWEVEKGEEFGHITDFKSAV